MESISFVAPIESSVNANRSREAKERSERENNLTTALDVEIEMKMNAQKDSLGIEQHIPSRFGITSHWPDVQFIR
jgi:hypothetical protein